LVFYSSTNILCHLLYPSLVEGAEGHVFDCWFSFVDVSRQQQNYQIATPLIPVT